MGTHICRPKTDGKIWPNLHYDLYELEGGGSPVPPPLARAMFLQTFPNYSEDLNALYFILYKFRNLYVATGKSHKEDFS